MAIFNSKLLVYQRVIGLLGMNYIYIYWDSYWDYQSIPVTKLLYGICYHETITGLLGIIVRLYYGYTSLFIGIMNQPIF